MKFMIDFNKSIAFNKKVKNAPFLVAHRGVNAANIPCNTLAAYKIAVKQGAEVVEIDVSKSKDGEYFCFHPGTEPVFLKTGRYIPDMTAEEVKSVPLLNQDEVPTHYRIPTLKETFELLKDRVYINVDKFWTDVKGITGIIRECGVEKQVIVKTEPEPSLLDQVEKYAPDLMYMGIVRHRDDVSDALLKRNVNYVGAEVIFDDLCDPVASGEYVSAMHDKGLLVWANSIVYNENDVISGGLTDDEALLTDGSCWTKLADMGFDFIQTDYILAARAALERRER